MLLKLASALLMLFSADVDDSTELLTCNFKGNTPFGRVAGKCTTQSLPGAGFNARWRLTLIFNHASSPIAEKLQPDRFWDMVRQQNVIDGSYTVIMPLWGDIRVAPDSPEYIQGIKARATLYETRPNVITITHVNDSPHTVEVLFEERPEDFNPVARQPTGDWMTHYVECFKRLGTNRPDGFSR